MDTRLPPEPAKAENLEGFDLIFTTVELPRRTELPVIFIHEIFNEQELRHPRTTRAAIPAIRQARGYFSRSSAMEMTADAFSRMPVEQGTQDTFEKYLTIMLDRFLTGHPIGELSTAFYRLNRRRLTINIR